MSLVPVPNRPLVAIGGRGQAAALSEPHALPADPNAPHAESRSWSVEGVRVHNNAWNHVSDPEDLYDNCSRIGVGKAAAQYWHTCAYGSLVSSSHFPLSSTPPPTCYLDAVSVYLPVFLNFFLIPKCASSLN
jgi:hypothetical protein